MRTRLFLSVLLLAAPLILFSQDEIGIPKLKPSGTYWGIGYYASGSVSIINDYVKAKGDQLGWGGSMEVTHYNGKFEMMIIASKNSTGIDEAPVYPNYETFEFTLGPRFKLDNNGNYFAEITVGGIGCKKVRNRNNDIIDPYFNIYTDETKFDFGFSAGFGIKFPLSKYTSLLFKSRMVTSLPVNSKNMVTYISASTGIVFNNRTDKNKERKAPESYFGLAAMAGLNNPNTFEDDYYQWSSSLGFEMNYNLFPKVEFIVCAEYNPMKFNNNENISNHKMLSAVAGGRFFINENPYTAFIEFMGGLYEYTYLSESNVTEEVYEAAEDNFGICIGTGTKLKLHKLLDFILKSNLNFIFSGQNQDSPDYLTIHGGLRYNF